MIFELSDEQKDIQRAAMEFARGEFDPDLALELDQSGQFPGSIWKKAAQLGFIGIQYPDEYGGQGLGHFEYVLVIEAFCRADSGIGSALCTGDIGSELLLKFGSHEQKRKFLPPLAKGEKQLSAAFAHLEEEKECSIPSSVAKKSGEGYLLQVEKSLIPNLPLADAFIIFCNEPKEGWITLIVEKDEVMKIHPIEKMGLRMIPFGYLHVEDFWVPVLNRLGYEGVGMTHIKCFNQAMAIRRLAQSLGAAQGAFDLAIQHAKQREQFSRKLLQFQVIRHKLADMAVSIEVARWLTYNSAIEYDQGRIDSGFLPLAQLEVGRRSLWAVDEALQIFGGYGYVVDQAIEHYYRDIRTIGLELGTEDEQKDVIAERILGPVQ